MIKLSTEKKSLTNRLHFRKHYAKGACRPMVKERINKDKKLAKLDYRSDVYSFDIVY